MPHPTQLIQELKRKLLEEEKRLVAELATFAEKNSRGGDDYHSRFPNFGDKDDENAAEVALYQDSLSLEQTLEKDLRDVRAALKRIQEGSYGICKYCQQEISAGRLQARPASSSCIKCKERLTKRTS